MIISFVMNESKPEGELLDIKRIILDSAAFNMIDMVHQHNYKEINIDDPVEEDVYVMYFTSIPYTLQHSIELNVNTTSEWALVCDEKILVMHRKNNAGTLIQKLDKYIPNFLSIKQWYQS